MPMLLDEDRRITSRAAVQPDPNVTLAKTAVKRYPNSLGTAPARTPAPTPRVGLTAEPADVRGTTRERPTVLPGDPGQGGFTQTRAEDPRAAAGSAVPGDMRGTRIASTYTPQHTAAVQAAAAARVASGAPIAATDLTAARSTLSQARGELGNISIGADQEIAGTDLSLAREAVGRMRAEIEAARLRDFGPVAGTDTTRARQNLDAAQGSAGQLVTLANQEIAAGTYAPSAAAQRARVLASEGLEQLHGTPDRTQLALRALALEEERSQPAYTQRLREVARKVAAMGRQGSGMTTNDLTGVEQDHTRGMNQLRESLLIDAGSRTLEDRLARLNATASVGGQFRQEDIGDAQMLQSLRDEARTERGARSQLLGGVIDTNRALSQDEFGLARNVRSEALEERDFQAQRDVQAANLALSRAGAYGDVSGREGELSSIVRRDAESDRDYTSRQELSRAQLAAQRLNSLSGIAGQEADFSRIVRSDAESDRSYGLDLDRTNASLGMQGAGLLGGLDDAAFGRTMAGDAALRQERSWQNELAQTAIGNRERELLTQDQLRTSDLNRRLALARAQAEATGDDTLLRALLAAAGGAA